MEGQDYCHELKTGKLSKFTVIKMLLIKVTEYFKTKMKNMNRWRAINKEIPNADEEPMLFKRTLLHLLLLLWIQWHRNQSIGRHKQLALRSFLAQGSARSRTNILTAWTGAAMSICTQTPGQSKPMWEAMKSPAQELGVLSRSCRNNKNTVGLAGKENANVLFLSTEETAVQI